MCAQVNEVSGDSTCLCAHWRALIVMTSANSKAPSGTPSLRLRLLRKREEDRTCGPGRFSRMNKWLSKSPWDMSFGYILIKQSLPLPLSYSFNSFFLTCPFNTYALCGTRSMPSVLSVHDLDSNQISPFFPYHLPSSSTILSGHALLDKKKKFVNRHWELNDKRLWSGIGQRRGFMLWMYKYMYKYKPMHFSLQ